MRRKFTLFIAAAAVPAAALGAAARSDSGAASSQQVSMGARAALGRDQAWQGSRRRTRPNALSVREGQAPRECLLRRMRDLLAAAR
jgi:hypothetical protein